MEDSNFIFVNYIQDSASGRQDAGFMTIDKNGNEITKKSFNYYSQDWNTFINRKHFIQVSEGSFFLAGGNVNSNALICKIDKSTLDTIKTIRYENPGYSFKLNNLVRIHSNRFFLVGDKGNGTNANAFVIELDSSLTILDQHDVLGVLSSSSTDNAILNPVRKELVIQGKNSTFPSYSIRLTALDTFCSLGTSSLSVSSQTRIINQVYFSSFDSTFVCLGYFKTGMISGFPSFKMCISKYDINFKLLWQKTYGQSNGLNAVGNAVILADGSIVTCGKYTNSSTSTLSNSDYNGVIIKVDKDGRFRWMREYSHYGSGMYYEGFYGIDRTLDNGFILCGSIQNLPNAKAWAVKTDSIGCVTPGCVSSTVTVDSLIIPKDTTVVTSVREFFIPGYEFRVFPNPANSEFIVETISDEPKILSVFDLQGREVKQLTFTQKETVSTSDLSPGVYLIKVFSEGRLLTAKKVVVVK